MSDDLVRSAGRASRFDAKDLMPAVGEWYWVKFEAAPGEDDGGEHLCCQLRVEKARLYNVDAYVPGDFRQFFDDPRTRAKYLRWAPILLLMEDEHARRASDAPGDVGEP